MKTSRLFSAWLPVGALGAVALFCACQQSETKPEAKPAQPEAAAPPPQAAPPTTAATATVPPAAAKPSGDHKNHPHPDGGPK